MDYSGKNFYIQYFDHSQKVNGQKVHTEDFEKIESILETSVKSGLIRLTEWHSHAEGLSDNYINSTIRLRFTDPLGDARKKIILDMLNDESGGKINFVPENELSDEDIMIINEDEFLVKKYKDDFKEKEVHERLFI